MARPDSPSKGRQVTAALVRCVDCKHGAMRDDSDAKRHASLSGMAKLGMVNCSVSTMRAMFTAWDHAHPCKQFARASDETIEARVRWFEGRE